MTTSEYNFSKYFDTGEILKPEFDQIKKKLSRTVGKEYRDLFESRLGQLDSRYNDLYYFFPNISTIKHMQKKMAFLDDRNQLEKDIRAFYKKWRPISDEFAKLKSIVKTTTQKRAETKEKKENKIFSDKNPLVKAILVDLATFVNKARESADGHYDARVEYLEENGGIDKVAPDLLVQSGSIELKGASDFKIKDILLFVDKMDEYLNVEEYSSRKLNQKQIGWSF